MFISIHYAINYYRQFKLCYLLILLFFCTGCNRPCGTHTFYGADELVIDSYKIRQGQSEINMRACIEKLEINDEDLHEYDDQIVDGDILNISLYYPQRRDLVADLETINLQIGFCVYEGVVYLPLVGSIEVGGLDLEGAQAKIIEAWKKHFIEGQLFVRYKERLHRKVELIGAIEESVVPVDGKMRLYELLTIAKVNTSANFFKSYVIRNGQQLDVDLNRLVHEGDLSANIVMRAGDRVFIAYPNEHAVYMMGEIKKPGTLSLPHGLLPLREALTIAGGVSLSGDLEAIQVIRGAAAIPKIYVLSWRHIAHLSNNSLLLIPGDAVYIPEKAISSWNRFVCQLLPRAFCFNWALN